LKIGKSEIVHGCERGTCRLAQTRVHRPTLSPLARAALRTVRRWINSPAAGNLAYEYTASPACSATAATIAARAAGSSVRPI
jgi:hypothetical protein